MGPSRPSRGCRKPCLYFRRLDPEPERRAPRIVLPVQVLPPVQPALQARLVDRRWLCRRCCGLCQRQRTCHTQENEQC